MTLELATAGESHGPALVAIVSGLPAGLVLHREAIDTDLRRRQQGYGRSPRQQIETDEVEVLAGLRHGRTLGTPLALVVRNRDHKNWTWGMSPWPPGGEPQGKGTKAVTLPRPGHADLAGVQKFGLADLRDALERASARHTAVHVAAGAVAKALLAQIEIEVRGEQFYERSNYAQVTREPFGKIETIMEIERLDDLRQIHMRCTKTGTYAHWLLTEAQGDTFVEVEFGMDPIRVSDWIADKTFATDLDAIVQRARDAGLERVLVILEAVVDTLVPADGALLEQIANDTGGVAFQAATGDELRRVYADVGRRITYTVHQRDLTMVFVGGALVLALLGLTSSLAATARIA